MRISSFVFGFGFATKVARYEQKGPARYPVQIVTLPNMEHRDDRLEMPSHVVNCRPTSSQCVYAHGRTVKIVDCSVDVDFSMCVDNFHNSKVLSTVQLIQSSIHQWLLVQRKIWHIQNNGPRKYFF